MAGSFEFSQTERYYKEAFNEATTAANKLDKIQGDMLLILDSAKRHEVDSEEIGYIEDMIKDVGSIRNEILSWVAD